MDLGLERAKVQGHDMANEGSSDKPGSETAYYGCKVCGAAFTVGYPSDVSGRRQSLEIIADTATKAPCSGPPASA